MAAPDPKHVLDAVSGLRQTYSEAEILMMRRVARRIQRGITTAGWAEAKLAEIAAMNRELSTVVSRLNTFTAEELGTLMREAEIRGAASGSRVLATGDVGPIGGSFTRVNPSAMRALYSQTYGMISSANLRVLRSSLDAYRSIVASSASQGVLGVATRTQVSQRMLDQWAKAGLTSFTDAAGRRWEMGSYAEMSSRTAITRSFIQGRLDQFKRYTNLVQVDTSPEECPICQPWAGQVLSTDGKGSYESLDFAMAAGLFHPNCTHNLAPYFEDQGALLDRTTPDIDADPNAWEEREQQRYLERNTREWKRREAVAVPGSAEQRRAQQKVKEWQGKSREFTKKTGRARQYDRESITAEGRRTA